MTLPDLLGELRQRKIRLSTDGGTLKVNAPAGALTAELRAELTARKPELIEFLRAAVAAARQERGIVPLQAHGHLPAVFAVAGHNGDVFTYREFAEMLGDDQPFYGLEPPGLDGRSAPLESVPALAGYFADQIRAFQPHGPYVIAGFCAGGTVAFELVRLLEEAGATVSFLAMFACPYPVAFTRRGHVIRSLMTHLRRLWAASSMAERRAYLAQYRAGRRAERVARATVAADPVLARRAAVGDATLGAVRRHTPRRWSGRVVCLFPGRAWLKAGFWPRRWRAVAPDIQEYFGNNCSMDVMLRGSDAQVFVEHFRRARARHLSEAGRAVGGRSQSNICAASSVSSTSLLTSPPPHATPR